ncbi:MAG: protein kinase [Myxococcales bacterium]|nr:protein kinase [Myxococcales bacterium]
MVACLSDTLLVRVGGGALEPHERAAIDAHIDVCGACRELVAALARDADAARPSASRVSHGVPLEGDERFEILGLLGAGGMGVVYEAFDRQRDEVVALKTLPDVGPEASLRLKDEFRMLADVRHPNLVRLHDLFVTGGRACFTMERIVGLPLDEAVGPTTSPERLREVFGQLAEALAELHRRGLVHRDVKPANVLVTADGRLVLLDLGLAAPWREVRPQRHVAGTAAYIAPEQVRRDPLEPAADWYAFGGCLYRCLSGAAPFRDVSARELLRVKQAGNARPPTLTHADRELRDLAMALLDPDPAARPGSLAILAALGVEPTRRTDSGLVGREVEVGLLHGVLAVRAAHLVVGPPGMGKTALVGEALRRTSGLVFRSRCRPREHVPFNALDGLIDGVAHHLHDHPEEAPRLTFLAALFPTLAAFAEDHAPVETASVRFVRRRAYEELAGLLDALAARRPLVLFVDDLHWADAESVELLGVLLERPREWTFLATARTGTEGEPYVAAPLLERIEATSLSPLAPAASARLLRDLGVEDDVDRLVEMAAGEPLWLHRIARASSHRTVGLDALLEEELDALDPEARRLLELTARAGLPLGLEVLGAATGRPPATVRRDVEELAAKLLLRVEPPADAPTVEPFHDRVRELALRAPTPLDDHRALARALADGGMSRRAELFAVVDHAEAAEAVLERRDRSRFAGLAADAAREARRATAYESCARYARLARRWQVSGESSPSDVRALELLEMEALYLAGRADDAERLFEAAIRRRAPLDQLEHWVRRVRIELVLDEPDRALRTGRRALEVLGAPMPDRPSPAGLATRLLAAQVGTATRLRRALDDGRRAPPKALAEMRLLAVSGLAATFAADLPRMVWIGLRNLELTLAHGLGPDSGGGIAAYGAAAAILRRYGRAREAFLLGRAAAERFADTPPSVEVALSGWIAPFAEHPAVTEARLASVERGCERDGDAYHAVLVRSIRLGAAWQRGAPLDELDAIAAQTLEHVEAADLPFHRLVSITRRLRATLARLRDGADLPLLADPDDRVPTYFAHVHEAVIRRHWGEVPAALDAIREARRLRHRSLGQAPLAHLYSYLLIIGCEASEMGLPTGPRLFAEALESLVELRRMARVCPATFGYRHALAWAEAERWRGGAPPRVQRAYDRAIAVALEAGNLEYEAVARSRALDHRHRHRLPIRAEAVDAMRDVYIAWGSPRRGAELAARLSARR